MITDPDKPGYRYPQPGDRLWHVPWQCWIVITGQPVYGPSVDEVDGEREDNGQPVSVKLRSLEETA